MKKETKNESHNAPETCPSCGHCPTCGRSNGWHQRAYIYPYQPWPYWYYTPTVTYGTYTTPVTSGTLTVGANISSVASGAVTGTTYTAYTGSAS